MVSVCAMGLFAPVVIVIVFVFIVVTMSLLQRGLAAVADVGQAQLPAVVAVEVIAQLGHKSHSAQLAWRIGRLCWQTALIQTDMFPIGVERLKWYMDGGAHLH